jgi:hypothetical protein
MNIILAGQDFNHNPKEKDYEKGFLEIFFYSCSRYFIFNIGIWSRITGPYRFLTSRFEAGRA